MAAVEAPTLQTVKATAKFVRREGKLYNTCPVFDRGHEIARYDKRHPTLSEIRQGITPGQSAVVIEVRGVRIAPLVCADVLQPGRFDEAGALGARILFTPVVSPFRPDDTLEQKEFRDRSIFLEGARRARAFVVKTAAPGRVFGGRLQGRSLVAAPWGFLARDQAVMPGGLDSMPPSLYAGQVRRVALRRSDERHGRSILREDAVVYGARRRPRPALD